ncbi:MAG: hypothetical protein ACYDCQ_11050 [Dehalococcoidia bacterium]
MPARDLLIQLRKAAVVHDEAIAGARAAFEAEDAAGAAAEAAARAAALQQREAAVQAAEELRQALGAEAAATFSENRRLAASYAESIRTFWSGADTALGLADLRPMQELAQRQAVAISAAPEGIDPERELARCVTEADKSAKRIDATVQQAMSEGDRHRRTVPRLLLVALIAIASAGVVVVQAVQPCSFARTAIVGHAGCGSAAPKHGPASTEPAQPIAMAVEQAGRSPFAAALKRVAPNPATDEAPQ